MCLLMIYGKETCVYKHYHSNKFIKIVNSSNEQPALMHFPNQNELNCVCELGHCWFKQWLVAPSLPSHYQNLCGYNHNWIFGDNFQSKHECVGIAFWKMSSSLSRPKCANISYGCLAGCLLQQISFHELWMGVMDGETDVPITLWSLAAITFAIHLLHCLFEERPTFFIALYSIW